MIQLVPIAAKGPRGVFSETLTLWGSFACLILGGSSLIFIILFILREAYPALFVHNSILSYLFVDPWEPLAASPSFGILHSWVSTIYITTICLILSVPMGYGIGLFLSDVAPRWMRATLQPCLDLLAGIPSVVYGFVGYVTLVPWFERKLDMPTGESVLVAGIVLAVMVLPFVASTSAEAFRAVSRELRETSMNCGVTRWYTVRRVVIPKAVPGMFAAAALGFARAIGETLAVLILAGNSVSLPDTPLSRGQPITALIATELGEAGVGSEKYHALFGAGIVLLIIIVAINAVIWSWKGRLIYNG